MTLSLEAQDAVVDSNNGGPTPSTVTGSITFPTVTNGVAIIIAGSGNVFDNLSIGTADFDGNSMSLEVSGITSSSGGGKIYTAIYSFVMGANVTGDTVNYTFSAVNGNNTTAVGAVCLVFKDCDQTSPVGSTSSNFSASATSSTVSAGSAATSIMVDGINRQSVNVTTNQGGGQTFLENYLGTGAFNLSGATSSKPGTGSSVTNTWSWTSGSTIYTAAIAEIVESIGGGGAGANITSVTKDAAREPNIVNPTDTAVDVVGTDFDPVAAVGPTVLYLADSTNFITATKTVQTYNNLTDTSLDWDVSLGTFPQGDLFLFIVTDEGEAGEEVSAAFAVIVSVPDVHVEMRPVASVASGGITESFDFDVKAVLAFVSGGTPDGTTVGSAAYGFFFTAEGGFDGGYCIGSTDGSAQYQREVSINVDGSVNILPDGNGASASKVFGRISISGKDVDFTHTLTQTGYSMNLLVIGGRTAKADAAYVEISDNAYTLAGFKPDVLFAMTTGETKDTGGDTTFALSSFGVAIGSDTADQWSMNNYHGSTTANKNAALRTGFFCNQLNEGSYTWGANLTAFTTTGATWGGSNSDGMLILLVNTDTLGVFATTVQKPTTATTQVLPDFGFTPGGIILSSCTRTDTSTSFRPTQRRSEMGFGFGDSLGNTCAMHAIDGVNGGVSDAEMSWNTSNVLIIPNRVSGPALSIEASATLDPIVDSTPSIVWDSTGEASLLGVFGIEATIVAGEDDIFAQMFDV